MSVIRPPFTNETALAKVRDDKTREAGDGFDGSRVAHPDLVPVCREVFDSVLGDRPNQLDRQRPEVTVTADDLLNVGATPPFEVSEAVPNTVVPSMKVTVPVALGLEAVTLAVKVIPVLIS